MGYVCPWSFDLNSAWAIKESCRQLKGITDSRKSLALGQNRFQFLVNQTGNFHFWCPDDRWRHVRLRGWWLHNRKNTKKWWNWWSELLTRDWTWNFAKVLKWIFRKPFTLFVNILAWHHSYQNLEGFKVENWRKNDIFLKSFWP